MWWRACRAFAWRVVTGAEQVTIDDITGCEVCAQSCQNGCVGLVWTAGRGVGGPRFPFMIFPFLHCVLPG